MGAKYNDTEHDVRALAAYYPYIEMLTIKGVDGDPRLPYSLVFYYRNRSDLDNSWGSVSFLPGGYRFPSILEPHRAKMYERYPSKIANKGDHDNLCPRVARYDDVGPGGARPPVPHFSLQVAAYADQIGTNMYPDSQFDTPLPVELMQAQATNVRLWDQLRAGTTTGLPEFHESGLANTLGVAVGILAKNEHGEQVICWRRRSEKPRVYTGQPHVPMSFALNIRVEDLAKTTLRDVALGDFRVERMQELGLEDGQFTNLLPVAFCRDLARAGKPQLFLEKRSNVPFETLRSWVRSSVEYIGDLEAMPLDGDLPDDASDELRAYVALHRGRLLNPE